MHSPLIVLKELGLVGDSQTLHVLINNKSYVIGWKATEHVPCMQLWFSYYFHREVNS